MLFVQFKNPRTGELKQVKIGWSWTLFFFSGFLGIPLFMRKLTTWGALMAGLWFLNMVTSIYEPDAVAIFTLLFIGFAGFFGAKGNEMTAKNYLDNGWEIVDPSSDFVKMAKLKWKMAS
ncbi:hypothetical protein [Desulfocurvibacter africanus]|uniref:hypothetical protein n=1 Tax=Desulfocurvibacter africanus TaxID=873 RepID=UPI00040C584E|nr:hypothetical protein [Desulfocurvibacter africanus]